MKLLFDENMAPQLVRVLQTYTRTAHVHEVGLGGASDNEIWSFAKQEEFTIVSKDADFGAEHALA